MLAALRVRGRWLWLVLVILLVALQLRVWWGQGSREHIAALRQDILDQQALNDSLRARNHHLIVEVKELQEGHEGLEEKAREDMGMVRRDETYFLYLLYEQ